jgi:predicted nucleic acid-binding protein
MIAIDTDLLIYAHRQGCMEHRAAQDAIEPADSHPAGWSIPLPCLLEFWSVVTHPAASGGPTSPQAALRFLEALAAPGHARILQPAGDFSKRCLQSALRMEVRGPRVFDLQIALLCQDGGVSDLWTHDRGFVLLPGLEVHDPLT